VKALIFTASYVPVLGGLQTAVHSLARHMRESGHDVHVVANRYPRGLAEKETIDGVPVRRWLFLRPCWAHVRRRRPDLVLASLYYFPCVLARLRRLMHVLRPDVLNVHFPDTQIPFVLSLRHRFRFRLVVSLHGDDVMRFTSAPAGCDGSARPTWLRAVLREADAVTACSPHLLDDAVRLEPTVAGKCMAIFNGIDPVRFMDKTAHRHPRPYVLALGRLTHKKGFDMLLDALDQTSRTDWRPTQQPFDLIMAGDGEERTALEAQARRLGLAERVRFHGRANPSEVVRLLNGCLFVVVPSRVEPFGIVALEGLAAGKPVLAADVDGMGQFLGQLQGSKPGFGAAISRVAPTADGLAEGLRERLAAAASNTRLAEGISRFVLDEHSWQRVAKRYLEVLAT
jgi:glycosyltransferase involved in cell wall biosynthesis